MSYERAMDQAGYARLRMLGADSALRLAIDVARDSHEDALAVVLEDLLEDAQELRSRMDRLLKLRRHVA